jgi:hypothetical protein
MVGLSGPVICPSDRTPNCKWISISAPMSSLTLPSISESAWIWVVINTHQSGGWGSEVKSSTMPFEDAKPFDLHILVLHNEYQVSDPGNGPYLASMGS